MTNETFSLREHARALSFKHLSECYFLPDPELLHHVRELEKHLACLSDEAKRYASSMGEELESLEDLDSLKVDYARLFVGPYKLSAPPYGSVYLEGERKIMGISTDAVRDAYREAGLDVAEDFHDLPDHIAAELEFMYFLICREVERALASDLQGTLAYLERQRHFLASHLGGWVASFARDVEASAEKGFYRNLVRCTRLFVEENLGEIDGLSARPEFQSSENGEFIVSFTS